MPSAADNSRENIASYSVPTRHVWCLISLGEFVKNSGAREETLSSVVLLFQRWACRDWRTLRITANSFARSTLRPLNQPHRNFGLSPRVLRWSAEAHPMREVDFRTLALRKAQISSSELGTLRELLRSSKVQHLDPQYNRYWGSVEDFGQTWQIAIVGSDSKKSIVYTTFNRFSPARKRNLTLPKLKNLAVLSGSYERR